MDCRLLDQPMAPRLEMNTKPEVDLDVSLHPPQSASV